MAAAVAVTWGTAWLQFLKCFEARGGLKPSCGGSLEALGSFLAPLEGSLAVLLASRWAPGAGLEASWAQMAPFWELFWVTFWDLFWDRVWNTFFN